MPVTGVTEEQWVSAVAPGAPVVQARDDAAPAAALVSALEGVEEMHPAGPVGLTVVLASAGDAAPFYS